MYLIGPTDGHVMTVTWIQRMSTVETQWTSRCWKTFRTNIQNQSKYESLIHTLVSKNVSY